MRLFLATLALWLASVPLAREDMSGRDLCDTSWTRADPDGDGVLDGREATLYLAMMYLHKVAPPEDGRIDRARFVKACLAGTFRTGHLPSQ
jgi:hypothetical protein